MNRYNRKKARNKLGVTEPVLNALIRCGLLGYTSATGMVSDQAVRSYQRFGTQWEIDGRFGPTARMLADDIYENLPPVEGIGPQPPATRTHMRIYAGDEPDSTRTEENDAGARPRHRITPSP